MVYVRAAKNMHCKIDEMSLKHTDTLTIKYRTYHDSLNPLLPFVKNQRHMSIWR